MLRKCFFFTKRRLILNIRKKFDVLLQLCGLIMHIPYNAIFTLANLAESVDQKKKTKKPIAVCQLDNVQVHINHN